MYWDLDTVDRVFDDFIKDFNVFRRDNTRTRRANVWTPAIDVHENDKEFVINAELPVCKKKYAKKSRKMIIYIFLFYLILLLVLYAQRYHACILYECELYL